MNPKTIIRAALLVFVATSVGYLVVTETHSPDNATVRSGDKPGASPPGSAGNTASHRIIAYYFHNTQRCSTCLKIEQLAGDALKSRFGAELQSGRLEWHVLNMEETANEHFVKDYALVTSSLVIVDMLDGQQHAWKNMERVWELVHDDEGAFRDYVAKQVRAYLES